ncbi:MAG: agmatine deiminase family protein [Deltaproteobacteria bacterium]|nr:agmatine deiminase family protein [Deltaproteobacteria bacterium]
MPAEWEPHEATWISWPHNPETWPGKLEPVPAVFAAMVAVLHEYEEVRILAGSDELEASARRALRAGGCESPNVRFFRIPTNDAWVRDHGPIFVVDGRGTVAMTDWRYNAWGGKYPPYDLDDRVPERINETLRLRRFEPGIVLEGGSIDVNGRGTLLTTESCLLNGNRNPTLSRQDIERHLEEYLGVRHVVWLGDGVAGDDTDGHVDDLARFVAATTVAAAAEPDPADENYRALQDNLRRLRAARDERGRPLEIVELPTPPPLYHEGRRLPASYANFYVGNRAVLVPVFDHPRDEIACETLARLFPGRRIAPIPATDLVWGLGACHCVTQQQPRRGR